MSGIVRLRPAAAARWIALRRRMLADAPWAFGATPDDDPWLDEGRVAARLADPDHATFAVDRPEPAGTVCVTRASGPRFRHRARIEALFVEPAHRGRGLGRALVEAAIDHARGWPGVGWLDLGVSAESPAARRLYEHLGFRAWGREPEATAWDGRLIDELHLARPLADGAT